MEENVPEDDVENEEHCNKPNPDTKSDEKLPELFEGGTMRSYQIDGFRWLVVRIGLLQTI